MGRRTLTPQEKRALAEGWIAARSQGETQAAYARRHGTSARRIRQFVSEYVPVECPEDTVRHMLEEALAAVHQALRSVERMASTAPPPARRLPTSIGAVGQQQEAANSPPSGVGTIGAPVASMGKMSILDFLNEDG
jgi:hypothetical protein